jgi:hypothetical protein
VLADVGLKTQHCYRAENKIFVSIENIVSFSLKTLSITSESLLLYTIVQAVILQLYRTM